MLKTNEVGLFGKLPAHGDFIYRDLPSHFINAWDTWLQSFVANTQEQLGDSWLDIYLTSPIWRFSFTDGIVDEQVWTGIVLPSVDRVGRYFPFSIVARAPVAATPFALINEFAWFEAMEELALAALEGKLQVDDLVSEIQQHKLNSQSTLRRKPLGLASAGIAVPLDESQGAIAKANALMLDAAYRKIAPTYSVWATALGSERVSPSMIACNGLPSLRSSVALLDGDWASAGWYQPLGY